MLSTKEYAEAVVQGWKDDAAQKGQRIPENFPIVQTDQGTQIWGASHFKYLVLGRKPGKFPPVDAMMDYTAHMTFDGISQKSLAYLIGRKLAKEGSDIHQGKKPGIDFLGPMDKYFPELVETIAKNETAKILTNLRSWL